MNSTKPSLWTRTTDFVFEWFGTVLLFGFVAFCVFCIYAITTREPDKYLKAPVESCKIGYTGQQKTEEFITYQCAAYDSKMNCTVQIPITNSVTYQEVNNQCSWNEWR